MKLKKTPETIDQSCLAMKKEDVIVCMCDMYTNSAEGFPAGHTSKVSKSTFMGRMISSRDMTPDPGHLTTIFNLMVDYLSTGSVSPLPIGSAMFSTR